MAQAERSLIIVTSVALILVLGGCNPNEEQPGSVENERTDPEISEVQVEPQDPELKNSPIDLTSGNGIVPGTKSKKDPCFWNDKKYSDGGRVCEAKKLYRCWDGQWLPNGNC